MYTIYVVFKCYDGKREAFVERAKAEGIVDAVRAENGCIRYDYYFAEKDPNQLLLVEAWETEKHQQVHIDQPHMELLRSFKDEYVESTTLQEYKLL